MASLNEVNLIGNLGRDPEYRATPSGRGFTLLVIATSRYWRDSKSNEARSETDWHRVVLEGKAAETARDYLTKGRLVHIQGRMRTRTYEKDGQTRYITEVISNSMQMLDKPVTATTPAMTEDQKRWAEEYSASGEPDTASVGA